MGDVLRVPDDLPKHLAEEYDVSDLHSNLKDMILSRKGVSVRTANGGQTDCFCNICVMCYRALMYEKNVPKYAIANGFAIGSLPEDLWSGTTAIEKNL